jgi:hypothetical protein
MEGGIEHGAWSIEQISDFGLQNADLRQAKPAKLAKQAKLIVRFFCGSGFPQPEPACSELVEGSKVSRDLAL